MNYSLEGKKIIIAGGSSGIGLATARLLAGVKASVTVTGRDTGKLDSIRKRYREIQAVQLDSSDRPALDRFFAGVGKIDHLIISSGGHKGLGSFKDLNLDELKAGFEEKYFSQLQTLQSSLSAIKEDGSIVLTGAITSRAKLPGTSGIGAINGALEIMVPILAKELKPIRINAVSPGAVDTPWWDFLPPDVKKQALEGYAQQIPVGRVAQPEEIADAILFLIENEYMTGCVLECGGGIG